MAQFDALLAILEPEIKKKTTNFGDPVRKDPYGALCCETKWMNLTIAILDFGVRLYGGFELSKHLSNMEGRWRRVQTQRLLQVPKTVLLCLLMSSVRLQIV